MEINGNPHLMGQDIEVLRQRGHIGVLAQINSLFVPGKTFFDNGKLFLLLAM